MNMKKTILLLAAAIALAASCSREQIPSVPGEQQFVNKTFNASSGETKTSLTGGNKVLWTSGDMISVFDNVSNKNNPFSSDEVFGNSAVFSGFVADGASEYVAVYPYKYGTTYDAANRKITTTFPIIQKAVKGGFDNGLNLMYAVSDGETLHLRTSALL